jgi:hypothetical protein
VRRLLLSLGALASAFLAIVPVAGAATAHVASTAVRGSVVFVVGVGFAPPNEFCRSVRLRIDGVEAPLRARRADDTGTWLLSFKATQPRGVRRVVLSQICESGKDGSLRTTSAVARLRIT